MARRRTGALYAGVVVAIVLGLSAVSLGLSQMPRAATPSESVSVTSVTAATSSAAPTSAVDSTRVVEVPDVAGMPVKEATIILEAAGFSVALGGDTSAKTSTAGTVSAQRPSPGEVAEEGSSVHLSLVAQVVAEKPKPSKRSSPVRGAVVCIDPGHQRRSDSSPEPIGPGADKTKPRVTGGTTGVDTGLAEYEVVLQIAMNLKARLERQGIKVVMTRTTNDVNLSNSERAAIANRAKADLFIRIHADGNPEQDMSGVSTLRPGDNRWTGPIRARSAEAARHVHSAVVSATGAVDRGIKPREDLSGFNYSKVPSVLVECGFMSNPVEDRLLSSPHYQDKLASGMAAGVVRYLESEGGR